ncbi:hypothetical protein FRZ67_16800 [Panacibacter ginsenosidivorans]|uniref:histidine kinase n=1 Tax=Panacibacter ginsenosidivorans TaxID=1813871 RepID=A0A5B8VCW5_9BACT|nr:ATP-binding protein [Panacibacter ginsenosidivorans]QEC68885.1 hypothetical protein FRZ67_16800 [Panacibacter ginsenosidivorans]
MRLSLLNEVLQVLPDLYFIYDVNEKKVLWCNRYTQQQLENLDIPGNEDFLLSVLKEDTRSFENEWKQSVELMPDQTHTFLYFKKDSDLFKVIDATKIYIEDNHKTGLLVCCKQSFQNLLQQQIGILKESLTTSEKKLEALKNMQNDFIAHASHDLQSPLRKLNLYLEKFISTQGTGGTTNKMYVERIKSLSTLMTSLINNFVIISYINDQPASFENCDLNKILKNVLADIKMTVKDGTFIVENSLPVIKGESFLLKNLFTQLLYNSVIFKKEDTPLKVTINASSLSDHEKQKLQLDVNCSFCSITITDNGLGFDNEDSVEIFTLFYKLQGNSIHKGFGMGLATSRLIMKRHRGLIFAKGEKNFGAQFTLILPVT